MAEEPINKKIRIKYEKDNNYRVIYADDVLVGQNVTDTALTIDFFIGSWDPMNEQHIWSEEKKGYDKLLEGNDFAHYTRTLQVQIVMTPASIEGMINALTERLKILRHSKK